MIVGILTNLSVCWVVVRNSQARTARNLFIINMAFSDLTVCCITMPATVMKLINHTWKYGDLLCRLTRYILFKAMKSSPFLRPFCSSEFWGFSLLKI